MGLCSAGLMPERFRETARCADLHPEGFSGERTLGYSRRGCLIHAHTRMVYSSERVYYTSSLEHLYRAIRF